MQRAGEEAPTQLLSPGAQTGGAPVGTSPVRGADTDAVRAPQPTAYHEPLSTLQQTAPLASVPPRKKRRRGVWLVGLLLVFAFGGATVLCLGYVWWRSNRMIVIRKMTAGDGKHQGIPPPLPPDLPDGIKEAVASVGVPMPLDESGANVSGDQTVLTKTYPIDEDATVSIKSASGSVTIIGTDGPAAEVKITKRGGSADMRRNARVLVSKTDEQLSLVSASAPGGPVSISYEIKLPRGLRQIEIFADTGDVKVTGFEGALVTNVRAGDLEFRDVTGTVHSKLVDGKTKVVYEKPEREGEQEFSVVKGDIEAVLGGVTSAELKAETTVGDISVDDALGLTVEKRPAGRRVVGQLGEGGNAPLVFKVVNGDIKLKK